LTDLVDRLPIHHARQVVGELDQRRLRHVVAAARGFVEQLGLP